jgi:predicted metal-dependent hydrolase
VNLLAEKHIQYVLKRSGRARYMRITINHLGEVKIVAPLLAPVSRIEKFIQEKSSWIESKRNYFIENPISDIGLLLSKRSRKEYLAHKEGAFKLLVERVAHFNAFYKFPYSRISIRNQKTRWGSCTSKGVISFNYKMIFLPEELRDYIVVHELCHLKQLNHSKAFWDLVAEAIPNHKALRKKLKGIE